MPRQGWKKSEKWTKRARRYVEKYDLDSIDSDLKVFLSPRVTRLYGQAFYAWNEIMLSEKLIKENSEEKVDKVLRHELGHLQAGPGHGHTGKPFTRACAKLKTPPSAIHGKEEIKINQGDIDYVPEDKNWYNVMYAEDGETKSFQVQGSYNAKQQAKKILMKRVKDGEDPRKIEYLRIEKVMGTFKIEDGKMEEIEMYFQEDKEA